MDFYYKIPNYPADYLGQLLSSLSQSDRNKVAEIYYSNNRLERAREKQYKEWQLSDPPHEELLVAFYVPRNSIGHPGIWIPDETSHFEMERMKVFLSMESMHQQLKQDYDRQQKKHKLLLDIDST